MNIAIIITAAGSSTRMGGSIKKEYLSFKNGTVLSNCAKTFLKALSSHYNITNIAITYPPQKLQDCKKALYCDKELCHILNNTNFTIENLLYVQGAETRQKSVYNALLALKNSSKNTDYVLIHDGARPYITETLIQNLMEQAIEYKAVAPGVTPTDTQKEIDENGFIIRHLLRKNLTSIQTPQIFSFNEIYNAHFHASSDKIEYTDDTEIWHNYIGNVKVITGDIQNKKITYPGDLK